MQSGGGDDGGDEVRGKNGFLDDNTTSSVKWRPVEGSQPFWWW